MCDSVCTSSRVAGVVLASGLSRRFPGANKLLLPLGGVSMVRRTVGAYVAAGLEPVTVVVGHEAERVMQALAGLEVRCVFNPEYREGQSRALVHGMRALRQGTAAAVIGVADQPLLTPEVIGALVRTYAQTNARLVVPRYAGRCGNPVLFDRRFFAALSQTEGDQGGRGVIDRHPAEIAWMDVEDWRIGLDLDTPADYERLLRKLCDEEEIRP